MNQLINLLLYIAAVAVFMYSYIINDMKTMIFAGICAILFRLIIMGSASKGGW